MLLHTDLAEAGSKDSKTLERKLVKDVSKEAEQLTRVKDLAESGKTSL